MGECIINLTQKGTWRKIQPYKKVKGNKNAELWFLIQLLVERNCEMTPFRPLPRDSHTTTLISNKLYIIGDSCDVDCDRVKEFFYLDVSAPLNTQELVWNDLILKFVLLLAFNCAADKGGTNNDTLHLFVGWPYDEFVLA